jgi:UDP-N-acetylglucosamine acyltransferase
MIHATAIIHPTAQIAPDAEIGPYAIIGPDVHIGSRVTVGSHAVIEYADIGDGCSIFSHAVVGSAPQDLKYKNENTRIIIGDNTTIREFCMLNRGTTATGKTVIGSNCLLMAFCHVAHDCVLGSNIIMSNAATLGGHVEVQDSAVISSMVAVHQFTRIGKLAMIGGGSMVALDILPYAQAQGDRARLIGQNLVGMKRRNLSKEAIEELKSAYRTLFLSGLVMEEALDQLEATSPGREVREIIDFIHSSKRGIARHGRKEATEEIG